MLHFTPLQLTEHLKKGEQKLTLLDVREPWEYEICHIDDSILIPMGQIPNNMDQLGKDNPIVVICHHGIRSQKVAMYLKHHGFQDIINLTGGVDAWAIDVDLNMAKY